MKSACFCCCLIDTLSSKERKSYISAVKCLIAKPAKTPANKAPGAKSRFDNFVALHINQTIEIHYTGNFLSWHRYYTWIYEKALREECGYTGSQPVYSPPPLQSPLLFTPTSSPNRSR